MRNIIESIIVTPKRLLATILAIIIICLPLHSFAADRVIVFVNGWNDCCAWNMDRVQNFAVQTNFQIRRTAWSSFREESGSKFIDLTGTSNFIEGAQNFFNSLPAGTEVYLMGHSFGGDSILELLNNYHTHRIKFKLVAVLDPVGFSGLRESTKQYPVPDFVEYFYNRWQTNAPFPHDFKNSGRIPCSAKVCDQQEQSISRNSDYSSIKERCGDLEICPGKRTITNEYGIPVGIYPGDKQKRLLHQPLAYDEYMQQQIINIINSSFHTVYASYTPNPGGDGVIYAIDSNERLFWYKHDGYADGSAHFVDQGVRREISHGDWNNYTRVFSGH